MFQVLPFDDNLCVDELCYYFEKCLSWLNFGMAAPFISSDTMFFRPIYPVNGYRCSECPKGFTGKMQQKCIEIDDGNILPQHLALWVKNSGPSCSKLTASLVNDSLKFTSSDTQIC